MQSLTDNAVATNTRIDEGAQKLLGNAVANNTTLPGMPATQDIQGNATAKYTVVNSYSRQAVSDSGAAFASLINDKGLQQIYEGDEISDITVNLGGEVILTRKG